jgi:hypothetical protein
VLLHNIERQPAVGVMRQCHPRKPRRLNCAAVTNSWRPAQLRATRWRRSIELTTGWRNSDEEMSYDTLRRSLIPALDPNIIDSLERAGLCTKHLNRSHNRARVRSGNLATYTGALILYSSGGVSTSLSVAWITIVCIRLSDGIASGVLLRLMSEHVARPD